MTVYTVNLKTTGELWHTVVCLSRNGVTKVLRSHGITKIHYGNMESGEFQEWINPADKSQTATVQELQAVD